MIGDHQREINALVQEFWSEPKPTHNGSANSHRVQENSGVSHLADDAVLERMFAEERRGEEWRSLFYGSIEGYQPSNSEAVGALLWKLAFYTNGDAGQMEHLIRSSGLNASKFDEKRGSTTWLGKEIERAIEGTGGEGWTPPKVRRHGDEDASESPRSSRKGTRSKRDDEDDEGAVKRLSDAILAADSFAVDAGGALYHYAHGTYKRYGCRFIKRQVQELLEAWEETAIWSKHLSVEVVEYVSLKSPELWEKPPTGEINVENGILNLLTRELREHTPEFLSPVRIPVCFEPEATCEAWDKYVVPAFPKDAPELVFEMAADLIAPARSEQRAILMVGEGNNGKSTALTALKAFVGGPNCTGMSLQRLEGDRFSVARLFGKLANICPDLPSARLSETSMFKSITGGDRITGEYKYRESFEFDPFCRLVFSANLVPRSEDATYAFFRRWVVVPFERNFEGPGEISREVLDTKLSDSGELSGVLNRALDVLPRVRTEGFTESQSMREAWAEFREMTDPVSVWLDANTVEDANAYVLKAELLSAYNKSREKSGQTGMTSTAFGRAIKRLRPDLTDGQKMINGQKGQWVWYGLGIKTDDNGGGGGTGGGGGGSTQGPGSSFGNSGSNEEGESSRGSRGSLGFTNCFVFEETEPDKEGSAKINNKGNRVNPVNLVNRDLAALTEHQRSLVGVLVAKEGMSELAAIHEVLGEDAGEHCAAGEEDLV